MIRTPIRWLGAVAAVTLVACSGDSTAPNADPTLDRDIVQSTAVSVVGDLSLNDGLTATAVGTGGLSVGEGDFAMAMGPDGRPAGCSMLAGPFPRFRCAGERRFDPRVGSTEYTRTITYYDADGNAQDAFDRRTTARVVFEVEGLRVWSRSNGRVTQSDSSTISRVAELTGIAGDPDTIRVWNGEGNSSRTWSLTNPALSRTREMVGSQTTEDLIYRLPRSENPYPVSGTITRQVTVTQTKDKDGKVDTRTYTRTVVVTFDGTQFATITINGTEYTLDLATGRVINLPAED
jgi:hypothetical protein